MSDDAIDTLKQVIEVVFVFGGAITFIVFALCKLLADMNWVSTTALWGLGIFLFSVLAAWYHDKL